MNQEQTSQVRQHLEAIAEGIDLLTTDERLELSAILASRRPTVAEALSAMPLSARKRLLDAMRRYDAKTGQKHARHKLADLDLPDGLKESISLACETGVWFGITEP
jgi:hypothetical protein